MLTDPHFGSFTDFNYESVCNQHNERSPLSLEARRPWRGANQAHT
jgi:hypothetical protein